MGKMIIFPKPRKYVIIRARKKDTTNMRPQDRHESLIVAAVILAVLAVLAYYFIDKLSSGNISEVNNFEECAMAQGGKVLMTYPERCVSPDGRTFTKDYGNTPLGEPSSFEECVAQGYPVMESYPRRCVTSSGDSFTENVAPAPVLSKSGVRGMVTIGPTCPVVRDPNPAECADKPFIASFVITNQKSGTPTNVSSDGDGRFETQLSPGSYVIAQAELGARRMPSFSPVKFVVENGKWTDLSLQFDSGIR